MNWSESRQRKGDYICKTCKSTQMASFRESGVKDNKSTRRKHKIARRYSERQAKVSWADKQTMKDFYQEAEYFGYHIDHIVPLRHPLVCGLHVPDNLQALDPIVNIKKSNSFDPMTFTM